MHELSVTQGLLKICLEEGKKHNIKILKINKDKSVRSGFGAVAKQTAYLETGGE